MQLYYHKEKSRNFGDDLNEWLWDYLLPGFRSCSPDVTLIGVGTLLNDKRLNPLRDRKLLILGSGVGYGNGSISHPIPKQWQIRAVRGPHSARRLGLPREVGITDPAALLPDLPEFQDLEKGAEPLFIPHHGSVDRQNWQAACRRAGLVFLSPEGEAKEVIRRIAASPYVITEAMHGAIIADAFRVPWVPVKIGPQFNDFKWRDWLDSLSIRAEPVAFHPLIEGWADRLSFPRGIRYQTKARMLIEKPSIDRALRRSMQIDRHLSDPDCLREKQQSLRDILAALREEYLVAER